MGDVAASGAEFPGGALCPAPGAADDHAFSGEGLDAVGDDVAMATEGSGGTRLGEHPYEVDRCRSALAFEQCVVHDNIQAEAFAQRLNGLTAPRCGAGVDLGDSGVTVRGRNRRCLVMPDRIENAVEVTLMTQTPAGSC